MRRPLAIAGTVLAVTIALTEMPAACSDPNSRTVTLWWARYYPKLLPSPHPSGLHPALLQADVVAKVEVIDVVPHEPPLPGSQATRRVKVRVIEAIKNIEAGQVMTVETGGGSCSQYVRLNEIGMQAYVAGRLRTTEAGETVFRGSWGRGGDHKIRLE
jgi:hypothetical protein